MKPLGSDRFALRRIARWSALSAAVVGIALLAAGCQNHKSPSAPAPTTLTGRAVYATDSNRGVPGVHVRAVGTGWDAYTDSTGWFAMSLPNATDGTFLQLTFSKAGFNDVVTTLNVRASVANSLSGAIALTAATGGSTDTTTSGPASTIVLKSITASSIGVVHGGSNETSRLTFEVRDAQGRAIDYAHRVPVGFTLNQQPGGGATVGPDALTTDAFGLVTVALNSGTLAQSVQIRAQVAGTAIYSDPVPVAIHGGLPEKSHLSYAVTTLNEPGLVQWGDVDQVTAFVGDRYGNPVPTGTMVYFTSSAGVIQGSAKTDDHGRAAVDLVTASPVPPALPVVSDSAGLGRIAIQTIDENQLPITRSLPGVMFSGHTQLSMQPTTFALGPNGSQDFTVTVWDKEHHNPLTKGTTIAFGATLGTVGGQASITLPDTWDPSFTSFTFRLENPSAGPAIVLPSGEVVRLKPLAGGSTSALRLASASPAGATAIKPASVTVSVTSKNGNAIQTVDGTLDH